MATPAEITVRRMTVALSAKKAKVREGEHEAGTEFPIRRIDAGKLVLPSGRICANDAYNPENFPPLNRIVAPGDYPAQIVVAEIPKNLPFGNDRCAFLMVTFSDAPIASWEAVTAVAPTDPCFTDKRPNAFVQEGASAVFSPEAGAVHLARLQQQYAEQIKMVRQQAQRFGTHHWINYRPGQEKGNLIIVEGGFGDGTYECFVGLTQAGRVARLVIDFGIADAAA